MDFLQGRNFPISEITGEDPLDISNDIPNNINNAEGTEVDEEEKFMCVKCNENFTSSELLASHEIVHKNDPNNGTKNGSVKLYSCNLCSKPFHHPSSLLYHKETEHNTGKYIVNEL